MAEENNSISYKKMLTPATAGAVTGLSLETVVRTYKANKEHGKRLALVSGAIYITSLAAAFLLKKNSAEKFNYNVRQAMDEYLKSDPVTAAQQEAAQ